MKQSQTHAFLILFLCAATLLCPIGASSQEADLSLRTVCIDPGHGGKDPGCISRDGKTTEKSIVLSIAKSLEAKIKAAYPGVKVVMTRSDDRFIALSERAEIANRNHADLFISIHVNAVEKGTSASGFSIHTLGQSSVKGRDLFQGNMELCKRENAVILLEDDYTTTYQGFDVDNPESSIFFNLMQNSNLEQSLLFAEDVDNAMKGGPIKNNRGISQDPFLVLWKTTMPAVLIECGFMTNPTDLAELRSQASRDKIAENIFRAFKEFKNRYDSSVSEGVPTRAATSPTTPAKTRSTQGASQASAGGERYAIQVLASSKDISSSDSFFRGYPVEKIHSGRLNKYFILPEKTLEKAKKNHSAVKKYYPDSFIVRIGADGSVTRIK